MMLAHFIYRSQHPFIPSISFESETIFWDWILPSKELKNFLSIIQLYLGKRIKKNDISFEILWKSIKVCSKLKLAWIIKLDLVLLKIVTDHEELPHPIVTISRVSYEFLSQFWWNTTLHTRGHWCYNIFCLLLVTAAATHRTLTPGPRRSVDRSPCVRSVQMYTRRYLHCAVQLPALYSCTPPPHTSFLRRVVGCRGEMFSNLSLIACHF